MKPTSSIFSQVTAKPKNVKHVYWVQKILKKWRELPKFSVQVYIHGKLCIISVEKHDQFSWKFVQKMMFISGENHHDFSIISAQKLRNIHWIFAVKLIILFRTKQYTLNIFHVFFRFFSWYSPHSNCAICNLKTEYF